MIVYLILCQYVSQQYIGCQAEIAWCFVDKEPMCVLKNVKCDITDTGNIVLPERCYSAQI